MSEYLDIDALHVLIDGVAVSVGLSALRVHVVGGKAVAVCEVSKMKTKAGLKYILDKGFFATCARNEEVRRRGPWEKMRDSGRH